MFLTADDLAMLTGRKRPRAQAEWLRVNGWPVHLDANGRPQLLRSVVEARLGASVEARKAEPNCGALGGG